jgi:hypothetical protein
MYIYFQDRKRREIVLIIELNTNVVDVWVLLRIRLQYTIHFVI